MGVVARSSTSTQPNPPSEDGYPSWLPKRPPPPAPASTFHSSSINMLAAEAGPSDQPLSSLAGRKPTPRSVRIVSLQDSAQNDPADPMRLSTAVPSQPHSRIWSRTTGPGMSTTVVSRVLEGVPRRPRFRSAGLHPELLRNPSLKSRLQFFFFPLFVFAHIPLQTFFDFNAVFILIE